MTTNKKMITNGPIFMGAKRSLEESNITIFGVPYDGTTCHNPGTRFGPDSIRKVSNCLETYCPEIKDDLEDINYSDIGSLDIPHTNPQDVIELVKEITKWIVSKKNKPLMLGGEHSITIGSIKALGNIYKDLVLIHLDAHADLRDEWLGSKFSHACTIKRCSELINNNNIYQIGIRSGTKKEFKELKHLIKKEDLNNRKYINSIQKNIRNKPIYITIDIDWFDPSLVSGTGTPEPGGFFWQDFLRVLDIIKTGNIIGADLVELSPKIDSTEISSIVAAKITRTLIMLLNSE